MKSEKLGKKFRFLPDIATADLAFEAFGKNYSELLENAAVALESSMVELSTLRSGVNKVIQLSAESPDVLLFSFLEELVFLKDAERLLFNQIKCNVRKVNSEKWTVNSELSGEKINSEKHKLGVDVKAVTKHLFEMEKRPDKTFRCLVILDI